MPATLGSGDRTIDTAPLERNLASVALRSFSRPFQYLIPPETPMTGSANNEMSPSSFFAVVGLCLMTALVQPVPAYAAESSWSIAAPWWCYKTTTRCQKLDAYSNVLNEYVGCTIPATAYYNDGDVANMCINN